MSPGRRHCALLPTQLATIEAGRGLHERLKRPLRWDELAGALGCSRRAAVHRVRKLQERGQWDVPMQTAGDTSGLRRAVLAAGYVIQAGDSSRPVWYAEITELIGSPYSAVRSAIRRLADKDRWPFPVPGCGAIRPPLPEIDPGLVDHLKALVASDGPGQPARTRHRIVEAAERLYERLRRPLAISEIAREAHVNTKSASSMVWRRKADGPWHVPIKPYGKVSAPAGWREPKPEEIAEAALAIRLQGAGPHMTREILLDRGDRPMGAVDPQLSRADMERRAAVRRRNDVRRYLAEWRGIRGATR